jgi:molybdate transport system substrate-binding protein
MLRVLTSRAIKYAYDELVPGFGTDVVTTLSSTGAIPGQVASDAPLDLVIATSDVIDRFIAEGTVRPGTRVDLVRSGVGVVVKAGAPKPDIRSAASVRQALLDARSVGYSQGPSGVYLLKLFETLGIAAEVAAKAVQSTPGTPVARYVADGTAELGFQQVSEIINEPGIDFVGPLPDDNQNITIFSSGVLTRADNPAAAGALQAYLSAPQAGGVFRKHGLEPAVG